MREERENPDVPEEPSYLEADQSWSDDPTKRWRINIVFPFWRSESERLEYEHAIEETRGLLPSERLEAVRKRFGGRGLRRIPNPRQSLREREAELVKLRSQVEEGSEEWWDK